MAAGLGVLGPACEGSGNFSCDFGAGWRAVDGVRYCVSRTLFLIAAAAAIASAGAVNAKPFLTVDFPKEALSPDCKAHPVNVIGDARKEIVIVRKGVASIYSIEEKGPVLRQEIALPLVPGSGRTYYAFARIGNGDLRSLLALTPGGIMQYPMEGDQVAAQPQLMLKKDLIQSDTGGQSVQYFDFAVDLNADRLDDLLVPEQNSFSIYQQVSPMQFRPVELPRNPYKHDNTFQFRQELPEDPVRIASLSGAVVHRRGVEDLLIFDANGDGLQDLKYMTLVNTPQSTTNERHEIFLQRKGMSFDKTPWQTFEIPYEPTDQTFRDVNGDGRLDAIVVKSNSDLVNPRTLIKFYIAGRGPQQVFDQETERFVTKDPIGLVRIADFNSDGMVDFAMTFFSYQFGSMEDIIDLIVANKLTFKLQFYLGHGPRGFSRKPDFEKELTLKIKTEAFAGYAPILVSEDMNGDRIMDLCVRSGEDSLAVYPSKGGLSYPDDPVEEFEIPEDADVNFEDVDSDGLSDIIVSSPTKQALTLYISTQK